MDREMKVILKGVAASSGRSKGKVRVVRSPKEISKLREGEVLVAVETSPKYMEGMVKASSVVTDIGGNLSHPAIISRELGIPAVTGTGKATDVLKTGMEIIVDGNNGKILKKTN